MPDFVDKTDPTDQSADSTGCGMAFLSWLMSTGSSLNQIAPQMVALGNSGTLAQLYANLTSDSASNAWSKFQAAVQALPNGITNDDPFGAFTAAPAGTPARIPVQLAPNTLESQRQASPPRPVPPAELCPPKSRRLLPPKKNIS